MYLFNLSYLYRLKSVTVCNVDDVIACIHWKVNTHGYNFKSGRLSQFGYKIHSHLRAKELELKRN